MKNNFLIKSTLILSVAAVISKILGSIFRIPLQNIAGDEVLGIFSLVYPFYMVALTLSVAGIPLAISMMISGARANGDDEQIRNIFYTSSILSLFFGTVSFAAIYSFSSEIAYFLGGPSTRLPLIIVSSTLLIAPYMAVYRGFFQGFSNMAPTAVSQVIEQFVRVGIILLSAIYLSKNLFDEEDIAAGIMTGSFVGAAASFIYLRAVFSRFHYTIDSSGIFNGAQFLITGKAILKLSIPICIGAITMALLNLMDSLTIPLSLQAKGVSGDDINYAYGIYGRGLALVQILTVFATSIVLPLIPAVSSKMAMGEREGAKRIIGNSFFLISLFSVPAAIALAIIIEPINIALFTDTEGSTMMAVLLAGSLFTSLTVLGTGVLQGIGKPKLAAAIILVGAFLKIFLNIFLVKEYGILGAAIATTAIYIILFFLNLFFIWKQLHYNFFSRKIAGIIMASVLTGFGLLLVLSFFSIDRLSRIDAVLYSVILLLAGGVIYFILLAVFKVIGKEAFVKIRSFNKN